MGELPLESTWLPLVELALREDLGPGDVTSRALIGSERRGRARIEARSPLVVCGIEIARRVFHEVDASLQFDALARDGDRAAAGAVLARVSGSLRALLAGERSALNFLGRMCGVATFTRRFADAIAGTRAQIVDTRKTLPGWRSLDKYAVAIGGGTNHRIGLFDGILIKDNHIAAVGGVAKAVAAARSGAPAGLRIQIEVESLAAAREAIAAGADFLLLDNRSPAELREIAGALAGVALLEASGGVDLDNVRSVAETGVSRISIGALTHSAPNADVALEVEA
jgi:nicotinate-nucleotide pyrophosphorylase (carboxylating)